MPDESLLTAVFTRLLRIPFWLQRKRPFVQPQKLLILQPGGIPEILRTTPLVTVLRESFPKAEIDWAIYEAMRPVLASNPTVSALLSLEEGALGTASWSQMAAYAAQIRSQQYDTCVVPQASSWLAWLAWRSGIPQRVGMRRGGAGFGYAFASHAASEESVQTVQQLALVSAIGLPQSRTVASQKMVFYPYDVERTAVTQRLVESLNWLGDSPLFLVNPAGTAVNDRWPVERFVLLCNHLVRVHQAKLIIVGDAAGQPLASALRGLLATAVVDWTGALSLGELGALCEVADLYIGNHTDLTYIAVAADCPTIAIFGEKRPLGHLPYAPQGRFIPLWQPYEGAFSWANGLAVTDVIQATQELLKISA